MVFNLYDDVMHGAVYDMRLAALVRMMGFPITGSGALALGLTREKFMSASLLSGAGVPIPPNTAILATGRSVNQHKWHFPVIVQPSQEHAGVGLDRHSVVYSKKALRGKVREILQASGTGAAIPPRGADGHERPDAQAGHDHGAGPGQFLAEEVKP